MIKRFLYMCDTQLSSKQPVNRLDDIREVNENKLNRVAYIYNETNCDFTIHGGDLFNSYRPDIESINLVLDYVDQTGEFILLPGNHDLPPGGNPQHFERTIFSTIMKASSNIRPFSKSIIFDSIELKPIFYARKFGNLFVIPTDAELLIIFTHLLIGDVGKFTPIDTIISNAELFMLSHVHTPVDAIHNEIRFYNPGTMIRRRIPEVDIPPSVAVVTLDTDKVEYDLKTYRLGAKRPKFRKPVKKVEKELFNFEGVVSNILSIKDTLNLKDVMSEAYTLTRTTNTEDIEYIEKLLEEAKR